MKNIKLAIISDDTKLRDSAERYFYDKQDIDLVLCTEGNLDAFGKLLDVNADVVVTQVLMQSVNGLDIVEYFASKNHNTKVIVLSDLKNEVFMYKCLSSGASGYLLLPVNFRQLESKILQLALKPDNIEDNVSKSHKVTYRSLDERLSTIFVSIGIPPHIKGYQFLRDGVKCVVEDPTLINSITKGLYPAIATRYETSASKVERAIRHAIEVAWSRGKIDNINNLFGVKIYSANEKPTNGEFIALLADKMLLEGA